MLYYSIIQHMSATKIQQRIFHKKLHHTQNIWTLFPLITIIWHPAPRPVDGHTTCNLLHSFCSTLHIFSDPNGREAQFFNLFGTITLDLILLHSVIPHVHNHLCDVIECVELRSMGTLPKNIIFLFVFALEMIQKDVLLWESHQYILKDSYINI